MIEINVKVPQVNQTSYPIHIGSGFLNTIVDKVSEQFAFKSKFIITDLNVAKAGHLKALDPNSDIQTFIIDPPGEVNKTIDTVVKIIEQMEKSYLGRDSVILALGGGTVGDIAGFAASIFKRGIDVVQIPTTTVSQADSSVGGKTGVDSSLSKNAFGAFYHPSVVYIDVDTLKTLDQREYNSGLIESVKHALIKDADYFDFIEQNIDKIINKDTGILIELAYKNCSIKASVVEEDPTEKNLRRILNYGHTVGHAIESGSNFDLLHGESVALGIMAAGLIEKDMGIASEAQLNRINNILNKLGMPSKIPANISQETIIELLRRDKKAVNKWPRFVLLEQIGKVKTIDDQWAIEVDEKAVEKILPMLY